MSYIIEPELSDKEYEYREYIFEHIKNVEIVHKELLSYLVANNVDLATRKILERNIAFHDRTKGKAREFYGYRKKFYPEENENKEEANEAFSFAWNHHQKTNRHHWEYWVLIKDSGTVSALEMPLVYVLEMMCDWCAMSLKFSNLPSQWHQDNSGRIFVHEKTNILIKKWLHIFDKIYLKIHGI